MGRHCTPELLGELLEWNPLVIAFEEEAERLISMDIRLDAILYENTLPDLDLPYAVRYQQKEAYPELVRELFDKHQLGRLTIVGLDQSDVADLLLNSDSSTLQITSYNDVAKSHLVKGGQRFRKWMPAGRRIGITSALEEDCRIEGPLVRSKDDFVVKKDGWITISTIADVVLSEYL